MLLYRKQNLQMFKRYPILTLGNCSSNSADMFLQLVTTDIEAPAWIDTEHRECTGGEEVKCLFRTHLSPVQDARGLLAESVGLCPAVIFLRAIKRPDVQL